MNVNMNAINLSTSQVQNNVVQNNNESINIDKGIFVNLLNMVMSEKDTYPAELSNITDLNTNKNIMDLLLGKNVNNFASTADVNISDDEVTSCFEELSKDEKQESKKVNENIIGWFGGFNFANTLIHNPETETAEVIVINSLDYNENIKNIISFANPNDFKTTKDVTSNEQQVINNTETSDIEIPIPIKENTQDISSLAEKLISQVEIDKSKVKDENNIQLEFENNKPILDGYNKIIKVSDESSQIKNSVLSQVEDKIVYMASEQTEGTKHVTMELNPENMGKVDIKMTFENNKITVEIKAANEETQKILASNSEELSKILNKSAEINVTVTVKPHESQYEQSPLDYDSQNNGRGRQRNNYYYDKNNDDSEEESVFSQIINLRTLKLNNVV